VSVALIVINAYFFISGEGNEALAQNQPIVTVQADSTRYVTGSPIRIFGNAYPYQLVGDVPILLTINKTSTFETSLVCGHGLNLNQLKLLR
jgi:hypothetical protein